MYSEGLWIDQNSITEPNNIDDVLKHTYLCGQTHILSILRNPGRFGLNEKEIKKIYSHFRERMGQEANSRELIILMVMCLMKWIRVRFISGEAVIGTGQANQKTIQIIDTLFRYFKRKGTKVIQTDNNDIVNFEPDVLTIKSVDSYTKEAKKYPEREKRKYLAAAPERFKKDMAILFGLGKDTEKRKVSDVFGLQQFRRDEFGRPLDWDFSVYENAIRKYGLKLEDIERFSTRKNINFC